MTTKVGRPVAAIVLTNEEEQKLRLMARRPSAKQQDALRARIILGCAEGLTNTKLAQRERVCLPTVGKWRTRFAKDRLASLADAPRSGAPRQITDAKVEEIVTRTLESTPPGCTHWSSRKLARATNISEHSVLRIWHAFGLKPHLSKTFKLSTDPMFVEKVRDIVALYLNPPDKAIVLCVDEKSETQALERSQPILPLRPGIAERRTHDYLRHGTLSLFAAYDAASGRVLGHCHQRHRHQEFLSFLARIDDAFPDDGKTQLHLIVDNYATHKTSRVSRWFARHPRFHVHFTPTGSSWLNLVERFFGQITLETIRRGSFRSVRHLREAITAHITEHNKNPKPFVWTASADSIFRKLDESLS